MVYKRIIMVDFFFVFLLSWNEDFEKILDEHNWIPS